MPASVAFHIRRWDNPGGLVASIRGVRTAQEAISNAIVHNTNLDYADLSNLQADGFYYANMRAISARFFGSLLAGVCFDGAILTQSNMGSCNLESAGFFGAILNYVDFSGSDLENANFRNARLTGAVFIGCNLRGADFRGADLAGAVFDRADTREARFEGALNMPTLITINVSVDPATVAVTLPPPPPRPPRTLLDYCKQHKVKITVTKMIGPYPAGIRDLWNVSIVKGKRRYNATVEYRLGDPPPLIALNIMREQSREVDNGRGDCKCGCGILTLEQFAYARGVHVERMMEIEPRYKMFVESSRVLREVFGNDTRLGYPTLMRMDAHSSVNMTVTW
jgi:uncharacterized protein YjbI with pentapeptide repeats